MSQETILGNTDVSFKDFLFKNKRNRTILWIAAVAIALEFGVFKYCYPYANFIHGDSFSYLNAAYHNLTIDTYPIGYSKFLRFVSIFNKSDFFLTAIQYLFIQCCINLLLFTIFYYYKPDKIIQYILLSFIVFNPLLLHLANMVSSDSYFLSLSILWFCSLLWFIHQPSTKILFWHSIVLAIAFTVRYNALIYPFISISVILFLNIRTKLKAFAISACLLLCGTFVIITSYNYKRITNTWQFSPFSGWQMANNAMYAYRFVEKKQRNQVPLKFQVLDKMITEYIDSTRDVKKHPQEEAEASTFYMWSKGMPLMKYKNSLFKNDTSASELKKWASVAPLYKEYGIHIIKQYPVHFLKHFIWPNATKYYAPPIEFLENYNWGKDSVPLIVQAWFGYETRKVYTKFKDKNINVLNFYPILSGIINLIMMFLTICFFCLKGWTFKQTVVKGILLGCSFWLINALFTITASSAALRFQSFPLVISIISVGLLLDTLSKIFITNKEVNEIHYKKREFANDLIT
jgi:hypothetical protein